MPTKPVTYKTIHMRRGETVSLPSNPRKELDRLIGVEGVPNPYGVDIQTGDPTIPVVTIPWWRIAKAEVAAVEA